MLLLLASGFAQVVSTTPFTGEVSEGFEGFTQTTSPVACLGTALEGAADVCAPEATVGGVQVRDSLFLGCLLEARSGAVMAGSNDGPLEVQFDDPVDRFGAWMGTHANDGDVTIDAYAVGGTLVGSVSQPLGGSCNWNWFGIESTVPIASVRISHSDHGGALVDLDDMEADTVCGVGAPDADGDGVPACADCNDSNAAIFPGAVDDCDGVDDDCNGVVDDSPPGAGLASNQSGICAGSTLVCGPSSLVDPDYTLIPGFETDELTCDGLDNDCNGQVDDIDEVPSVSDLGVCATVPQICMGSAGWVDPNPDDVIGWQAVELACDGFDNDCDGEVDNNLNPPASGVAVGVCSEMVKVCAGTDRWQEPEDFPPEFGPEICNGLDDNCNGEIDDDCVEPSVLADCGCRTGTPANGFGLFGLLGLLGLRRRR